MCSPISRDIQTAFFLTSRNADLSKISSKNFERVLAATQPRVRAHVYVDDAEARFAVELRIQELADFEPVGIARQVPAMARLLEKAHDGAEPRLHRAGADTLNGPVIDGLTLSNMSNAILHVPELQTLEASWRGLRYLTDTIDSSQTTIRVLNVSKTELRKSLGRYAGVMRDSSPLFKKVFDEAYAQFGGQPHSFLIADMGFSTNDPDDCSMLEELMMIGFSAAAPVIASATPWSFGESSFESISRLPTVRRLFRQPQYTKWMTVRNQEEARYLGLCLPRLMMRSPYHDGPAHAGEFQVDELVRAHTDRLWGNAVYAVGAMLLRRAMHANGDLAPGNREPGNLIPWLPRLAQGEGADGGKAPVEATFTADLCAELADAGLFRWVRDLAASGSH